MEVERSRNRLVNDEKLEVKSYLSAVRQGSKSTIQNLKQ